jgi:DNA-binding transcriptional regulator YhcF (GntR family)
MLFTVDEKSSKPRFMQMVDGVLLAIREGRVRRGDALPSVLDICGDTGLARATVIKAYGILKRRGVVRSIPQKGYFVASEDVRNDMRILLLFDELAPYKQDLYDAFRAEMGGRAKVDVVFHHCDIRMFEALLRDRADYYDRIAVMAFTHPGVARLIRKVVPEKIILVDRQEEFKRGEFPYVGQGFDTELMAALDSAWDRIGRYRRMVLVMPEEVKDLAMKSSQAPVIISRTVSRFCGRRKVELVVVHDVDPASIRKGDLWFVIDDQDLVAVVEGARDRKLGIGRELGVLGYNETAMRRVVAGGVTVVSTDFAEMGRRLARIVGAASPVWDVIPTRIIRRKSL